ncbi:MAG: hypothetical protein Q8O32_01095 [bacterium]|nr:hypothetical protein [bacterium]
MINEDLKPLLEENKELLQNLDKRLKKIEKRFVWGTILGLLKFLIIFTPLIIGAIYFTPILKDYVKIFEPAYKTWISQLNFIPGNENVNTKGQNEAILESFCDPESRELMVKQFCK